jgi:hypothetical protein
MNIWLCITSFAVWKDVSYMPVYSSLFDQFKHHKGDHASERFVTKCIPTVTAKSPFLCLLPSSLVPCDDFAKFREIYLVRVSSPYHEFLTNEVGVLLQDSLCGICIGQRDNGTGIFFEYFGFPLPLSFHQFGMFMFHSIIIGAIQS